MQTKHYTINYLEKTGSFLKNLKEISYLPFKDLQEGIVLDLGCGTGADVINLAQITQNRVKVIGIDHDPILIDKALSNSASDSTDVEFILSEVYSIPFENNSIVGIRAERLLQHLIEPEKLIKEVYIKKLVLIVF
ncbi:MAG: methyltransferase domain-containing protein [Rickettsiales bacterium]|nr:MAG: methyltransferase domain-containing protein [Rickettsiales bacterium]